MRKIREEIKSSLKAQEYESLPTTDWKEFRRIKCCVVLIENNYYCLNTILIQVYRGIFKEVSVQDRKICSSLSEDKMPKMRVIREISRALTEEGTDNSLYNCNMPTHPSFPSEKESREICLSFETTLAQTYSEYYKERRIRQNTTRCHSQERKLLVAENVAL